MTGSSAETPATPEFLRASDAERDQAVDKLRTEFAAGRLSHDTFLLRMQTALDAQDRGQLARLFADLPPRRGARIPLADRLRAAWRDLRRKPSAPPGPPASPSPYWAESPRRPTVRPIPPPPPPAPAPLYFPPGSGTRFTIGRTQDCDLRLTDLSVSRQHALLTRRDDGWLLSDLGSHNGTRLNGWLVREAVPVRAGDLVEFGSAAFVLTEARGEGSQDRLES
jgi:hypothetical protein